MIDYQKHIEHASAPSKSSSQSMGMIRNHWVEDGLFMIKFGKHQSIVGGKQKTLQCRVKAEDLSIIPVAGVSKNTAMPCESWWFIYHSSFKCKPGRAAEGLHHNLGFQD